MIGSRLLPKLVFAAALVSQATAAGFKSNNISGVSQSVVSRSSVARISSDTKYNQDATSGLNIVPGAYIVELESKVSSIEGRSTQRAHAQFHKRAADENVDYRVRQEFSDESLFHGLSINVESNEDKAALERLPEVKRIWPVVEMSLPNPVGMPNLQDLNVSATGKPAEGFATEIIRGDNYKIDYNLKMAGAHHLHSHGFRGKGVKIAIIDSGVDYYHPALGGGFGPGKKVAFGRNYVDDGQGGPDDPIATCNAGGHGTHVAGIIGGQDPKDFGFGLLGVAPEATLGMYRVFSCGGLAANDVVMQSMMDAYNDGADIVSMSLGADNGFEDADPFGQIVMRAKERGIATVIAAGNAGYLGPVLTGSPAIAKDAIAVASMDSARFPTTYKMKSSTGGEEWRYSSLWPLEGDFTLYAGEGDEAYGCDYDYLLKAVQEVGDRGWNISNTFWMVRKSDRCGLDSLLLNGLYQGFKGIVLWRGEEAANPNDNNYPSSSGSNFVLGLDHVDGPKLYKAVTAGDPAKFRARFSDRRFLPVDNPSAGYTSNYSTFGNTWEYEAFKPLLAAPGHLILSTWPMETGGYSIISGTSMATPFVSGCYALLKQAFPKLSIEELTNLFTTTAVPAKWWGDNEVTHAVSHQGAGTINVWNAYNSGTKFKEGTVLLGETIGTVKRSITFTNTLGRSKTFDITHVPAGLMQRTPYDDLDPVGFLRYGFPSKPIYAKVEFETPTTVTLGPGESTTVSFVVSPPKGLDPDTIPQYSGYIRFISGRDVYNVPYQGLTYVINQVPVIERDLIADHPQLPAMSELDLQAGSEEFVTDDIVSYNTSAGDYPSMVYFARQPFYAYRLDLIAANTTFEPTYYGFNTSHELDTMTPKLKVVDTFQGVESLGQIFGNYYMEPVYHMLSWWGGLYDEETGTEDLVPAGDYRWLLRILPIKKDFDEPEDWTSWLGPVLRIVD